MGETRGEISAAQIHEKLERVAGVSRVIAKMSDAHRATFEVEGMAGTNVRPEVARAVVEAGWNLNELRPLGLSLEEVFLQLTSVAKPVDAAVPEAAAESNQEEVH